MILIIATNKNKSLKASLKKVLQTISLFEKEKKLFYFLIS